MVDADRRLHGDLHAPARHHRRERGAARHPAVAPLLLRRPAVGRRRLLAHPGRLPADRRRGRRHRTGGAKSSPSAWSSSRLPRWSAGCPTTPLMLNLARAVQGVGGAIMFATSLALIAQAFTGRERGTAFGIYGAVIGGAVAIGPLIGGRHHQRHRLALDLLRQRAHRRRRRPHHLHPGRQDRRTPTGRRIDWVGFVTFSGSPLPAGVRARAGQRLRLGQRATIVALLVGSAVLMAVFFVNECAPAGPDARPRPVQAPGLRGRLAGGLHPVRLDLRHVPVPDPLHPGRSSATARSPPASASCP